MAWLMEEAGVVVAEAVAAREAVRALSTVGMAAAVEVAVAAEWWLLWLLYSVVVRPRWPRRRPRWPRRSR